MFVVTGILCIGLFLEFSKAYGFRTALLGFIISYPLSYLPLFKINFIQIETYKIPALIVFLLSILCIFRNISRPILLVTPFFTIASMIFVWIKWPGRSFLSPGFPDGVAGLMTLVFILGGSSILAFILFIQCHTPLKIKSEQ